MSDSPYKPPTHPKIFAATQNGNLAVAIVEYGARMIFTPQQAWELGVALMETGLYLKAQQKTKPTEGTTNV